MTHRTVRRGTRLAVSVAVIAAATAATAPAAAAAPAATPRTATTRWDPHHADVNGDGQPDLVTGVPAATVGGLRGAGEVAVAYGAAGGIATAHHQLIAEGEYGIAGPAAGDHFGTVVPVDLNGDGCTDLVVGAPGRDDGAAVDVGTLTILWGGPDGLTRSTRIDTGPVNDRSGFGGFLAAGDFDGDGKPDLVTSDGADRLSVLYDIGTDGRPAAITPGPSVDSDFELRSIAVGDVNGDGTTDLVTVVDADDYFADTLYLGGSTGLTDAGVVGRAQHTDLPGETAAIGDVNGDGYGDIVMGRGQTDFDEDVDLNDKGGAVMVAYGSAQGPSTTLKPRWITQATAGVPGIAETNDGMGTSVAVADVNGDGYADVVTGVPGEDFDGITDAGSFLVLKGSATGLTGAGAAVYSQSTAGIPGVAEKGDRFGTAASVVAAVPGQGAQIAVGDPDENAGTGGVWVLRSAAGAPTTAGTITYGTATMGITPAGARFGEDLP